MRVGGRDYFWVGCESLWVRYWGRDGKGWGANLATFLSSDESRYGEVGSNVIFWGGGYKGWARYCWISLTKVHWKGVWRYKFGHHYLIWWKVTMDSCRNYHSDCRVAHMMALGWTDCKLGLAWCNAQGDKWLVDWSTYNDPALWGSFWGLDIRAKAKVNLSQGDGDESSADKTEDDNMDDETGSRDRLGFNAIPIAIKWPEVWGQEDSEKSLTHTWEDIMKIVEMSWGTNHDRDLIDKDLILLYMGNNQPKDNVANFFEKEDLMVEYLTKWEGCYNLNDHEAWRKMSGSNNQSSRWLDVDREAC
ncbi:hypothetical protein L1987_04460 [Smallanthus sonchifolius]|uniref:Uncharacterized protein n=1 Tax=Smallanthus sonchifolius TaxID=185202 RepID=A0ACB9JSM2_9ASTR|nr:hypothetical protein L1987_04460 [Smallanthus sonchifolius]